MTAAKINLAESKTACLVDDVMGELALLSSCEV